MKAGEFVVRCCSPLSLDGTYCSLLQDGGLPQATLARRGRDSTLTTPVEDGPFLDVGVAVMLDQYDHDVPILTYMDINNLAAPGPAQWQVVRAVDDSTGRSIADNQPADTCHGQLTAFDQKVFVILARTLRVSHCLSAAGCDGSPWRISF